MTYWKPEPHRHGFAWVENTTALVEMFGAVVPFEDEKQEEKDARP